MRTAKQFEVRGDARLTAGSDSRKFHSQATHSENTPKKSGLIRLNPGESD
jgi:hypothetical protein